MEIQQQGPISWASIVKKEKRFSIDIIQFDFSTPPPDPNDPTSSTPSINTSHPHSTTQERNHHSLTYLSSGQPNTSVVQRLQHQRQGVIVHSSAVTSKSSSSSQEYESQEVSGVDRGKADRGDRRGLLNFTWPRTKVKVAKMVLERPPVIRSVPFSVPETQTSPVDLSLTLHSGSNGLMNGLTGTPTDLSLSRDEDSLCRPWTDTVMASPPKPPLVPFRTNGSDLPFDSCGGDLLIVEEEEAATEPHPALSSSIIVKAASSVQSPPRSTSSPSSSAVPVLPDLIPLKRRGRRRKDHTSSAPPIAEGPFPCFLCDFSSGRPTGLEKHMWRMHTVRKGNGGRVRCTVCAYSSPSVEQLRTHQLDLHGNYHRDKAEGGGAHKAPDEPAFHSCQHCTKKFRSQSQLEAHKRLINQKQLWKDLNKASS